jgi:hypothetical protein
VLLGNLAIRAGVGQKVQGDGPNLKSINCPELNLVWLDPVLARRQILLHAAQQFLEGDVVHWFFRLQDGRRGTWSGTSIPRV